MSWFQKKVSFLQRRPPFSQTDELPGTKSPLCPTARLFSSGILTSRADEKLLLIPNTAVIPRLMGLCYLERNGSSLAQIPFHSCGDQLPEAETEK